MTRRLNLFFCLLPLLLVGCVEVHRGFYDATKTASGWQASPHEGVTTFSYRVHKHPRWRIYAFSAEKGQLRFCLSSSAYDPAPFIRSVTFTGDTIRVIFHDREAPDRMIAAENLVLRHCQTISVGVSDDFTVVLPSFKIGNDNISQFSARFKWSNRRYYTLVPVQ